MAKKAERSVVVKSGEDTKKPNWRAAWRKLEQDLQAAWARMCPDAGPLEPEKRESVLERNKLERETVLWLPGSDEEGTPPLRFVISPDYGGPMARFYRDRDDGTQECMLSVKCTKPDRAWGSRTGFDRDVQERFRRLKNGSFNFDRAIKLAIETERHYREVTKKLNDEVAKDRARDERRKRELEGVAYTQAGMNAQLLDNGLYLISFSSPSGNRAVTLDTLKQIVDVVIAGQEAADTVRELAAKAYEDEKRALVGDDV